MENTELLETEVAQTERIGLGDLVIVGIIAALTFGIARFWEFPGLYPGVWADASVAAYARPATHVLPGYWTAIATVIYSWFGIGAGAEMLRLAGHVVLAGVAVCVYAVLREWLAFAMRMRPQLSRRRTLVMRLASVIGAAAIIASDPVWTAGQCLSETTVLLGLTLGAIEFFFVFLRKGTIKYAYLCALVLGILAAETPMGILLPVLFIMVTIFIAKVMPTLESPFFRPSVLEVGKWHMTFIFLVALLGGIALNCWTYLDHDGTVATGGASGNLPVVYLLEYWQRVSAAASPSAWILMLGVCILPFVVATIKFPESADEENFLSYASGLIFFACGILVLAQASFIPALWFWTYFPVQSQYLLSVGLFCCAATLALSVTILGVDALCRNHQMLASQVFDEIQEDEDDDDYPPSRARVRKPVENVESRSTSFLRLVGIVVIPLFIIAVMYADRVKTTTRTMLGIIHDAVAEIMREAGDAKYLFTDGNLDAVLELEATRVGSPLKCYSLMGDGGEMSRYLRMRGLKDDEDRFSFKFDTAMGLRSWIRDKPARLAESAALMGFDLWKRDGKPLPPMGGLLSRPTGFPDETARTRGIKVAHDLAERILAVCAQAKGLNECTDPIVLRAFNTIQWRLARMCLYRSEAYDVKGMADEAIAEATLAKTLNESNNIYRDLISSMERRQALMMQTLTPREGLQLALVRADFTMGKAYAETIIDADPDNPDANFALGMYYRQEHQLSRAERYLLRCLIRKPDEPAVYNNLAMLQIELKKFDAARANIDKAMAIIPDSSAVLDTKRALEAAIEAAKNPPKTK